MSRQNNNKKQAEQKKFCKVCFDAGKSEAEYTSHFVRASPEPTAKVVCPVLLQAECGYCHEKGHTPSYCKLAKTHQKEKQRQEYEAKKRAEVAKPAKKADKKPMNVFAALMDSSDDEEEKKVKKQVKPTKLTTKPEIAKSSPKVTYDASANLWPALPTPSQPAAKATMNQAAKVSMNQAGKSQLTAALKKMAPELELAAKTPELSVYRPPAAKLVRRPRKLTPQEEEDQFINKYIADKLKSDPQYQKEQKQLNKELAEAARYHGSHYGEDDLAYEQQQMCNSSGYDVTDLYDEAEEAYKKSKLASYMDWAQTEDSDSDDEDW